MKTLIAAGLLVPSLLGVDGPHTEEIPGDDLVTIENPSIQDPDAGTPTNEAPPAETPETDIDARTKALLLAMKDGSLTRGELKEYRTTMIKKDMKHAEKDIRHFKDRHMKKDYDRFMEHAKRFEEKGRAFAERHSDKQTDEFMRKAERFGKSAGRTIEEGSKHAAEQARASERLDDLFERRSTRGIFVRIAGGVSYSDARQLLGQPADETLAAGGVRAAYGDHITAYFKNRDGTLMMTGVVYRK